MTRKITSMILALVLCCSLALCVSADPTEFVIDELGVVADESLESLNGYAAYIYEETGVGVFFVLTETAPLSDYDVEALVSGATDYVVMLENEENWNYFTAGKGDDVDVEQLRAVYDGTETYADGIGAYLEAAGEKFPVLEDRPQNGSWDEIEYLVFDEGELLSDSEEMALEAKLLQIGHTYNTQLTVCTTKTLDGADIDAYADGLYDYMKFGYGSKKAGVMVLVCMEPRQVCVFSNASITADDRTAIREAITPYLSDGEYAEAFDKFAEEAEYYINGNQNGFPFDFTGTLATCLIIGIVVGLIVAFVLKGQLKSVRKQNQANNYVKPGSMQVTIENDFLLYRTISRTRKSSNSSSGGSSSGGSSSRGSSSGSF